MATSAKKAAANQSTSAMPKKPPRRGKVPCGVCQGSIVDGKDDALLCEGECGLWFHRGCASVPPALYKSLSNSDEPFVCLVCTNIRLKREITQLKCELTGMADIRDKFSALTAEVATLRHLINSLQKEKPSLKSNTMPPKRTYARVARTASATTTPKSTVSAAAPGEKFPRAPKNDRPGHERSSSKVKVDGARRIWGTVQTCSVGAVAATISKLIPNSLQLRIRRKTKILATNKVCGGLLFTVQILLHWNKTGTKCELKRSGRSRIVLCHLTPANLKTTPPQ